MAPPTADFAAFFRAATGLEPYAYQQALGELEHPPAVLEVPTGAGKTQALIASWLYGRRVRKVGPRRLVYALPMRSLVEQTAEVARAIRDCLKLVADELSIRVLMGGVDPSELRDWRRQPECDQILIGTIDMLLSRALNRGYAESRFAWPVAFGLLNNDCRWVFDEVQLMGAARATSAQLDGLRATLGTALPCETIWASATIDRRALKTVDHPELGAEVSLSEQDRSGRLRRRLDARKTLQRVDVAGVDGGELAARVAQAATESHADGTRTLIVLNTVELAQLTYAALARLLHGTDVKAVLLHSRFRPAERDEHRRRALADPGGGGVIVVATQVIEAGVDVSARTLITETAPFSSIVQRLGRCNRAGEYDDSTVAWLDRGPVGDDASGRKRSAPYRPVDIEASRLALLRLEGDSLSPATLAPIEVAESTDDPSVLRRSDLLDLFDTTPDLSGMDVDIAPFIRDDDDRSIAVFFRDIAGDDGDGQPAPQRDELVQVSRGTLGKRMCWTLDQIDGRWTQRVANQLPSGATVMLRSTDGGYGPEVGWDGKAKGPVDVLPLVDPAPGESYADDRGTQAGDPQELLPHLIAVAEQAGRLADALELPQWEAVLRCAGALHDVGKAHPVFQRALREVMPGEASAVDGRLWAKSGTSSRTRYERPYFRHELASALAVLRVNGSVEVPARELTAYLIAAHHGKVRLSIRPAADESRPRDAGDGVDFALGVVSGDVLPAVQTPVGALPAVTLDMSAMRLGADDSWTDAAVRMRDDPSLGPFRLGFLEALLRIADWRASGA